MRWTNEALDVLDERLPETLGIKARLVLTVGATAERHAAINYRDYVLPDDVAEAVDLVVGHTR